MYPSTTHCRVETPAAAAHPALTSRLTCIKMLAALVLVLGSVAAVYASGSLTGKASMPAYLWIVTALCVWAGSLPFAAFGLVMGYR
jgi:ABC-2 type transport system permease protein